MLSTVHQANMVDSRKVDRTTGEAKTEPETVMDYNTNMRLIDKSDMQISGVECVHKSVCWYKNLFFSSY